MDALREYILRFGDESEKSVSPLVLTLPGTETFLLYDLGFPLRQFAAFEVCMEENQQVLEKLSEQMIEEEIKMAIKADALLILDAPTWRASPDYLKLLEYKDTDIEHVNATAVAVQKNLQRRWESKGLRSIIGAEIGPRGDGYVAGNRMDVSSAESYHTHQVNALKKAGVELITAYTMTYQEEALGIAVAAAKAEIPVVLSATVETNGHLPDGSKLSNFIESIDSVLGDQDLALPLYYMINCAHPTHFEDILAVAESENNGVGAPWLKRLRGIRANSSCKSHDELDKMETIDNGDPDEFGRLLKKSYDDGRAFVLGGCCGTDHRHIEQVLKHLGRI